MPQGMSCRTNFLPEMVTVCPAVAVRRHNRAHNFKVIGEHIDDFALALIAPLGAENHRGLCFADSYLPNTDAAGLRRDLHTGAQVM